MLLRKRQTSSSIIAIALLVAVLASVHSIVNHINSQVEELRGLANTGGTFLVLSRSSTSLTDSEVNVELVSVVSRITSVKCTLPQRALTATLVMDSGNHTIPIRGVGDVASFLDLRGAYVNGTTARSETEANVGEILAKSVSINLKDELNLAIGKNVLKVKVVGIVRTQTQSDTELIVPIDALDHLTGNKGKPSFIEFVVKDNVNKEEAIDSIIKLLPTDVKVVKAQQLREFLQDMNQQTLAFINVWSMTVYAVVAGASYVVSTILITECTYELAILKVLGAKRGYLLTLVLTHALGTALLGSILGIALGIAGAQTVSTIIWWVWPSVEITPSLEPMKALQILLLTIASSILGCAYPAARMDRKIHVEPLQ